MKKRIFFLTIFLSTLLSFSLSSFSKPVYSERTLNIGVAVSREFKNQKGWKRTFERRLKYAARIFKREFKLNMRVTKYWDWRISGEKQDIRTLADLLMNEFPLGSNDIIIGLTVFPDADELVDVRDLEKIGLARPFSGYLVLRYPLTDLFKVQQETVLIHELGHLFGAVHTNEQNTIMAPVVKYHIPTAFDSENREIISMTRGIDFKKGFKTLGAATIQRLVDAYTRLMTNKQPFEFYYTLGYFYLKGGQFEDALKAWEKASKSKGYNSLMEYDLGMLYYKTGKPKKAIRSLNKAARKATEPYEKSIKRDAFFALGTIYFEAQDYSAAYRAWSSAAAVSPNDSEIEARLASLKTMQGQYQDAMRTYTKLLKKDPKNTFFLSQLGYIFYKTGNSQKAIDFLKLALKQTPQQTKTGDMSIIDSSEPSELYKYLSLAYWQLGRHNDSIKYLQTSCKMNSTLDCNKQMGLIFFKQGKWDKAIYYLSGVLAHQKKDADLYGAVGVAFSRKGDNEKAASVFSEGLRHIKDKKKASRLHQNLGNIYASANQLDLAIREYQLSIANDWKNAESYYRLGLIYMRQNRFSNAKTALDNALRENPKHKGVKKALVELDSKVRFN